MDFWDVVGLVMMMVGSVIATLFAVWGVDKNGMALDTRTIVRPRRVVVVLWVLCLIQVIILTGWIKL